MRDSGCFFLAENSALKKIIQSLCTAPAESMPAKNIWIKSKKPQTSEALEKILISLRDRRIFLKDITKTQQL